jgi:hypothetical protein
VCPEEDRQVSAEPRPALSLEDSRSRETDGRGRTVRPEDDDEDPRLPLSWETDGRGRTDRPEDDDEDPRLPLSRETDGRGRTVRPEEDRQLPEEDDDEDDESRLLLRPEPRDSPDAPSGCHELRPRRPPPYTESATVNNAPVMMTINRFVFISGLLAGQRPCWFPSRLLRLYRGRCLRCCLLG